MTNTIKNIKKQIKKYQNPPSKINLDYANSDIHKIYNKDKPLSPADPIGQFIVGNAILKPLTLIPKIFKYGAAKYFPKSKIGKYSKVSIINNELQKVDLSSIENINNNNGSNILLYDMGKTYNIPNYATINSKEDPLMLHSFRINHNWEKIGNNDGFNNTFSEGITTYPFKASSKKYNILKFDEDPNGVVNDAVQVIKNSLPITHQNNPYVLESVKESIAIPGMEKLTFSWPSSNRIYVGYDGINRIAQQYGKENVARAISHELDHAIHIPTEKPSGFKQLSDQYFSKTNGTELSARGSQLKDYFGLDADQELTEDMLKYAKEHYVKDTGLDNNMTEFFNYIDNFKDAAKWLSKHATAGLPASTIATKNKKYRNNRD